MVVYSGFAVPGAFGPRGGRAAGRIDLADGEHLAPSPITQVYRRRPPPFNGDSGGFPAGKTACPSQSVYSDLPSLPVNGRAKPIGRSDAKRKGQLAGGLTSPAP